MVLPTPEVLSSYFDVLLGAAATLAGIYATLRAKGLIVYPAAKVESGKAKIKALIEQNSAASELSGILENISPQEMSEILEKAKKLSGDGFSAAEAQELGILIVDAVKEK